MTRSPLKMSSRSIALILFLAAIALVLTVRLHTFNEPLERDLTTYAVIGHEMLEGRQLYSDLWDHKPPAIHLTYACAELLAGYGPNAIFLLGVLASLLTMAGISFAIFAAGGGPLTAAGGALFWGLVSGDLYLQANQPNTEVFINLFLTWGFAFSLRMARNGYSLSDNVSAGLCWAAASLYKMVAITVPLFVVPVIFFALAGQRTKGRVLVRFLAAQIGIGALAWLLVCGYFVVNDHFSDFYEIVFLFNQSYASSLTTTIPKLFSLQPWLPFNQGSGYLLLIVAAFGSTLLVIQRKWLLLATLYAYLVGALLAILLPGHFYPHYFQLILPVLSIMGGMLLLKGSSGYLTAPILVTFVIAGVMLWIFANQLKLSPETWSRQKYNNIFVTSAEIGRWLGEQSVEKDLIYELGAETGLYFYSQRSPAVGIFYDFPLASGPFREVYLQRVASGLSSAKPLFLILGSRYHQLFIGKRWLGMPESELKQLFRFIEKHYRVTRFDKDSWPFLVLTRQ